MLFTEKRSYIMSKTIRILQAVLPSTLTSQKGVYGFIFSQKGLMAGLGLVGQKITKIKK